MRNRWDIINYLIKQNGYKSYLEIGVAGGMCFRRISAQTKVGVDPLPSVEVIVRLTSDEFFASDTRTWDIIFIDGLHEEHQVDKDIVNSLGHLNPGGTIVLHDCHPMKESQQVASYKEWKRYDPKQKGWMGTVWRSFVKLRATRNDLECYVVDTDCGCGVVKKASGVTLINIPDPLTYEDFSKNTKDWLNLVTANEFITKEGK
jgi:hypothetical protein